MRAHGWDSFSLFSRCSSNFINTVYLGPGTHGFEPASQWYFHKPFKQLGEDDYIAFVACILNPELFGIHNQPERNAERVARIKSLVRRQ